MTHLFGNPAIPKFGTRGFASPDCSDFAFSENIPEQEACAPFQTNVLKQNAFPQPEISDIISQPREFARFFVPAECPDTSRIHAAVTTSVTCPGHLHGCSAAAGLQMNRPGRHILP
jgi:hypothetical protein